MFHQLQAYKTVVPTICHIQIYLDLEPHWQKELCNRLSNPLKLATWLSSGNTYPQHSALRGFYLAIQREPVQSIFGTKNFGSKDKSVSIKTKTIDTVFGLISYANTQQIKTNACKPNNNNLHIHLRKPNNVIGWKSMKGSSDTGFFYLLINHFSPVS